VHCLNQISIELNRDLILPVTGVSLNYGIPGSIDLLVQIPSIGIFFGSYGVIFFGWRLTGLSLYDQRCERLLGVMTSTMCMSV